MIEKLLNQDVVADEYFTQGRWENAWKIDRNGPDS